MVGDLIIAVVPVLAHSCRTFVFQSTCGQYLRISEERDSRFTKSRTVVSLIPGQAGVVDFRLPD